MGTAALTPPALMGQHLPLHSALPVEGPPQVMLVSSPSLMGARPSTPAPLRGGSHPGATLRWTLRVLVCRVSMGTVPLTPPALMGQHQHLPPHSVSLLEAPPQAQLVSSPLSMEDRHSLAAPLLGASPPGATLK